MLRQEAQSAEAADTDKDPLLHAEEFSNSKDAEKQERDLKHEPRTFCKNFLLILGLVISLLSLVVAVVQYQSYLTPSESMTQKQFENGHYHCGTNYTEAQSLGCKFDLMAFAWVHPVCLNETLSRAWEERWGPWDWYSSPNATSHTIRREELHYQGAVWSAHNFHNLHCLYSLETVYWAAKKGLLATNDASPWTHTHHCVNMLADPQKWHGGDDEGPVTRNFVYLSEVCEVLGIT